MDEKLFECRFTHDMETRKELIKFLNFRLPRRKISLIALALLFVIQLTATILLTVWKSDSFFVYWILTLIFPMYAALIVYSYFRAVSLYKKQVDELFGGKYPEVYLYFTETELHSKSSTSEEITVSMSSFDKVYKTDKFVILMTKAKVVHYFVKSGFVKGTPEELVAFLHGKGIK